MTHGPACMLISFRIGNNIVAENLNLDDFRGEGVRPLRPRLDPPMQNHTVTQLFYIV